MLLNLAQAEFDVLLTVDANIYHQQNVARYDISVIVLRVYENTYEALALLLAETIELLKQIKPSEIRYVYANDALRESDMRHGKGPYAKLPNLEK